MQTRPPFDLLAFSILLGLRRGLRHARTLRALAGKDRVAKEEAEMRVATAVADALRRANLRITTGPPAKGSADPTTEATTLLGKSDPSRGPSSAV